MLDSLSQTLYEHPVLDEAFTLPLQSWLILLALWAGVALLLILIREVVGSRLRRLAERTTNWVDDVAATFVTETRRYFLIGLALAIVAPIFVGNATEEFVGGLLFLLLLVQSIQWGNAVIKMWSERYRAQKLEQGGSHVTAIGAAGFVAKVILWSVVLLVALDNFGVDVTALVAGLGVGGIAIALAVQNLLKDLFAYFSIILDEPFVYGDFLIVGDYLGSVEKIGIKTTRLRSLSGEQLIFSNDDLLNSRIRNYKRMQERRVVFTVGVLYETSYDQLEAIPGMLRTIVEAQEQTRFDRAHFKSFADFSLVFEVVYYVLSADFNVYMDIQQAINLALFKRFEEEGIGFAYPTRTLYLKQGDEANGEPGGDGPIAARSTVQDVPGGEA